ncbi:MAG: hypothetical protein JSU83_24175 [Deltaproteobacteria bacterium]|nr:MAG: hypothetical protein JSU83_24175 [Deltaproteobacteria bacterium]
MKKIFYLSVCKIRRIIKRFAVIPVVTVTLLILSACVVTQVKPAHLRLTPESLTKRQLQTRIFDTDDESAVLAAGMATLQDIGFLVDESEVQLGLIVASKERSAIQPAEVTAHVILIILAGLSGQSHDPVYDETQIMRVSLVVTPVMAEQLGTAVRITFQRIVYTNKGTISKSEALGTPEIYREFFDKLSKALFLEAQEL